MVESWAGAAHSGFAARFSVLLVCCLIHGYYAQKVTEDKYFTNGWAIKVPEPHGYEKAKDIAKRHGFEKVSAVCISLEYRITGILVGAPIDKSKEQRPSKIDVIFLVGI